MKVVIFSDTHLTEKFSLKLFTKLKQAITGADLVIINGDFWDHYLTTFDRFLASPWQSLFKILKQHKTLYLYGNHDRESHSDERRMRFCDEAKDYYEFSSGSWQFRVEHGNRFVSDSHAARWVGQLTHLIQIIVFKTKILLPLLTLVRQNWNNKMKSWSSANLKENQLLVCGHSHLQEEDYAAKFINAGFNCYGHFEYMVVENGKIRLIRERY